MWARVGCPVEAARLLHWMRRGRGTYVSWVTCPTKHSASQFYADKGIRTAQDRHYYISTYDETGSERLEALLINTQLGNDKDGIWNWICLTSKSMYTSLTVCFWHLFPVLALQGKWGHGGPSPACSTHWGQRRLTLIFRGENMTVDWWGDHRPSLVTMIRAGSGRWLK